LLRSENEKLKAEKHQAMQKIEELERTVADLRKQLPAAGKAD
jgi:prefoldin subunit 5